MQNMPGHQRNASQGQHLIIDRYESGDEEDIERCPANRGPPDVSTGGVFPTSQPDPPICRPHDNQIKGGCRDPRLRSNYKVVLGAIFLTVIGSILLVYSAMVFFEENYEKTAGGVHWGVLLFAGSLCFAPGFYHVYYITCTLCGSAGYSFDKLPTFSR